LSSNALLRIQVVGWVSLRMMYLFNYGSHSEIELDWCGRLGVRSSPDADIHQRDFDVRFVPNAQSRCATAR
jgi:hypothetical protein